ncbi:glycosyltransferase [Kitasatospora purpeofusca]|uniref:glycosyltransferase n=1 Tax=Kitasatospora purpeofusca TaxID=67352 RepID=UPI002A5AA044|nr:glycosyltransferase [Kitasatospora purpeofusca]MDY0811082.1 glycosyltransferase [Kitasatospora purpeofusca]
MRFDDLRRHHPEHPGPAASRLDRDLPLLRELGAGLTGRHLTAGRDRRATAEEYRLRPPSPVTAVVLTRDEEAAIGPCLRALAADADRVLLIDSGSTDRTVQVARAQGLPVQVVHAPWRDDFSHHRNLAFRHPRPGWFLHVDADEVLAPESAGAVRRALTLLDLLFPDAGLAGCPEVRDIGRPAGAFPARAVRAAGALRFRGRVHERPYDRDGEAPDTVRLDVRFDHHGHRPEAVARHRKLPAYAELVDRCAAEEPDNPKWLYYRTQAALLGPLRPDRARSLYRELARALDELPTDAPGYWSERRGDSWALLCDLALRFGGAAEIADRTAQLERAARRAEAVLYRSLAAAGAAFRTLSGVVDAIEELRPRERPQDSRRAGTLYELEALAALAGGRHRELRSALVRATAAGAGAGVRAELARLRRITQGQEQESGGPRPPGHRRVKSDE